MINMQTEELLSDRTVDIIMITKRVPVNKMKQTIAKYMSDTCGCPISVYTDDLIYSVVKNAFFDFLYHAEKPSVMALVRNFFECFGAGDDDCLKMLIALGMTQIAERDENGQLHYINGFHNTDTKFTKTALDYLYKGEIKNEPNNGESKL